MRRLTLAFALSAVLSGRTLSAAAVATPVIQLLSGATTTQFQAQITCTTPGAVIHYTITGIDPTTTDPVVTSGNVVAVSQSLTLKAKAWDGKYARDFDT